MGLGQGVRGMCVHVTQMPRIDDLFSSAKLAYMETGAGESGPAWRIELRLMSYNSNNTGVLLTLFSSY